MEEVGKFPLYYNTDTGVYLSLALMSSNRFSSSLVLLPPSHLYSLISSILFSLLSKDIFLTVKEPDSKYFFSKTIAIEEKRPYFRTRLNSKHRKKKSEDLQPRFRLRRLVDRKLLRVDIKGR